MNEKLDHIIKNKITEDIQYGRNKSEEIKEQIWQNISGGHPKRKILPFIYAAASIALLVGSYIFISNNSALIPENIISNTNAYEHYIQNCDIQYGFGECTTQHNLLICSTNQGTTESDISNGMKQGNVINYLSDGTIIEKGEYLDGTKHGEWLYFDNNGQLIEKKTFNNGVESIKTIEL